MIEGRRLSFVWDRLSIVMTVLTSALLGIALAPLFFVQIPAMLDYVNHLARMYLLTGVPSVAYEVNWRLYPNLAMDLIVPCLARWIGVTTAAKLFLGVSQFLVVSGGVALEFVVKGRHRLGGLGALLVLFSIPFAWGEMNFIFGLGLAVWAVAAWICLRSRPLFLRWVAHAVAVATLFVCHFFALGVYGLAIGLYEVSRLPRRPSIVSLLRLAAFMGAPVAVAIAVMALSGGQMGQSVFVYMFGRKLSSLAAFFNSTYPQLSVLSAGLLLVLLLVLAVERRLALTRTGVWIAAGFTLVYAVLPQLLFDSYGTDNRVLAAAAVILPAFMTTSLPPGPWRVVPLTLSAAIILANETSVVLTWPGYQKDYAEFQASFPLLSRGSAVLVGLRDDAGVQSLPVIHAPTLAAPAADVFVSSLLCLPGQQPIRPRPAFRGMTPAQGGASAPLVVSQLLRSARGVSTADLPSYIAHWPDRYQYLYLVGAPGPNPLPNRLVQLTAGRRFTLYRIAPAGRL